MKFMDNRKIRTKLIIVALIFMALIGVISFVGYLNMKNINDGMTTLYFDDTVTIKHLGAANTGLYKLRGDLYKYVIVPEERSQLEMDINADIATINSEMQYIHNAQLTTEEKTALDQFDKSWPAYQQGVALVIADVKANNTAAAINSMKTGSIISNTRSSIDTEITTLINQMNTQADKVNAQGDVTFANATTAIIIVGIISAIISIILIVILTNSVAKPLEKLVMVTRKVATGDLTTQIPEEDRADEVGQLNDSTREALINLRTMTKEIQDGINVLATSVSELMATMAQNASGAQETATSIAETTATVEEVKQTADVSSQKAKFVADTATNASTLVEAGRESVDETIAGMNRIQQQMNSIGESIGA